MPSKNKLDIKKKNETLIDLYVRVNSFKQENNEAVLIKCIQKEYQYGSMK